MPESPVVVPVSLRATPADALERVYERLRESGWHVVRTRPDQIIFVQKSFPEGVSERQVEEELAALLAPRYINLAAAGSPRNLTDATPLPTRRFELRSALGPNTSPNLPPYILDEGGGPLDDDAGGNPADDTAA